MSINARYTEPRTVGDVLVLLASERVPGDIIRKPFDINNLFVKAWNAAMPGRHGTLQCQEDIRRN
jgi:hypothetical protein